MFVLAAVCYVPLLLTAPGEIGADTKSYLYIDPGRLLRDAVSMWDPRVGFGTVTHQTIGYLFPMGPFYWAADALGIPMWVAQRVWLGSILFLAGAGVWFLLRTLRLERAPATIAAFVYALTPYTLSLDARLSVILLPFTGLPWLIAFTVRAIRNGGWRDPALFALVVLTIGGVNATALVFAGVAPLLWFPFAVWGTREASFRRAAAAFGRIAVLSLVTSLWWIAGLLVQGRYGIDILRYTETAAVVAAASVGPEVLRSLGYWFFYGSDRLGSWIEASVAYTQRIWLLVVTYLLPVFALFGAALTRWRHRAYFVALVFAGMFIAVGAFPWDDPPLTGRAWKALLLSDRGLALRSTPRAVPLLALGLAALLASGFSALTRKRPSLVRPGAIALVGLAVLGLVPLYTGGMVASNLERPESLPGYWLDAAASLDAGDPNTRVLEVPGIDFASYRWGNTVDPITPGLTDRPYAARELIPYGSPASADLLNAFDRRIQENTLDPDAVAPIARLLGVGDIVARNDLQFERFRIARPYQVMPLLDLAHGLGPPTGFGASTVNRASSIAPLQDEAALRDDTGQAYAPVADFPVDSALPIVRVASANRPVLVAGDGEGLVALASAGLLRGDELIQYAGSFADDPAALRQTASRDSELVLTDANRRRARRWSTLRDNVGYTEEAGEAALREDLTDNRLPVFPDAGDNAFTVATYDGGVHARATSYGNPISYTPEFRAANAVDGDPRTAWKTGASSDVHGETLELTFDEPVDTDHITVTQVLTGPRNRSITDVDLVFDGGSATESTVHQTLDDSSNQLGGQVLTFPPRTFSKLELIIRGDDSGLNAEPGRPVRYTGYGQVGFSEVDVDGRTGDEVLRLPTDLLDTLGADSLDHPLTLLFERQRTDPSEAVREDEEQLIARRWTQPTTRAFALRGQARLSTRVSDDTADLLLGVVGPTATSSRRLPGDLRTRASAAIDGDPSTAWTPNFGDGDDTLTFNTGRPTTIDHLDLQVVADGRHSVPTHLVIDADGVRAGAVDIPAVAVTPAGAGNPDSPVATIPIDLPAPVTGSTLTFHFDDAHDATTTDWFSDQPIRMPIGIAELGAKAVGADGQREPALGALVPTGTFDSGCRSDLVTVDDTPVSIRISGATTDAITGKPLTVETCGDAASTLTLAAGEHVLMTEKGLDTGIDIDQLVLQSRAGGNAVSTSTTLAPRQAPPANVTVNQSGRTSYDLTLSDATPGQPMWLVLGQSHNDGWTATVDGHDLGEPQLVDGYANGWLLTPGAGTVHVKLDWTPQRMVWIALFASLAGALVCLVLAIRRPRAVALDVADIDAPPDPFAWSTFVDSTGARPSAVAIVGAVIGLGLAFAAIVGPLAGTAVALGALIAATGRRWRWVLALGAPALLALSALYVIARQIRYEPVSAFEWPGELAAAHQVALAAVAFLVALVVVDWLWARPRRT